MEDKNFGLPAELWSESPSQRVSAAASVDRIQSRKFIDAISLTAPMKPWPYGMPTVLNPYLVVVGASPGGSPPPGEIVAAYDLPRFGKVHSKMYVPDTKGYWDKIRELCCGLLTGIDEKLDDEQALSISGQLNLGAVQSGTANTDKRYVKWVPEVLTSYLRPRIIIFVGLLGILKDKAKNDGQLFAESAGLEIDWRRPDQEFDFRGYTSKTYKFSFWHATTADSKFTFVSWPNHPSRSPMTSDEYWRMSISEGCDYIKSSLGFPSEIAG